MHKIEYRVRPVTRFVVTRYEQQEDGNRNSGGCSTLGEYDNQDLAYQVGYALCKAEHGRLGWPPGDERILYPALVPLGAADVEKTWFAMRSGTVGGVQT